MKRKRLLKDGQSIFVVGASVVALIILIAVGIVQFKQTHFGSEIFIRGVDCSFLNVEEARAKIEEEVKKQVVFKVALPYEEQSYKVYEPTPEQIQSFEITLSNTETLQRIIEEQKSNNSYFSAGRFEINEEKVREYLMTIPELQEENMVIPQKAYLVQNEKGLIEIVPQVLGNLVDVEKAYEYAIAYLKDGLNQIDLTFLAKNEPNSDFIANNEELKLVIEEINSIISSTIHFQLPEGTVFTLDHNIMKGWISITEDKLDFSFTFPSAIAEVVEMLCEKVNEASSSMVFNASEIGNIEISVNNNLRPTVDKDAEFLQIQAELKEGGTHQREPMYNKTTIQEQMNSYVELDITRQTVWLYVNGECILKTPCVTGSVAGGHSTPTGIYLLTYKTTDAVLRGYNNDGSRYASPVDYWMPFNGGIGFHDASWRNGIFGGEIYKTDGSHGCVNLPFEAAKTLYQYIDETMPIIVYKS